MTFLPSVCPHDCPSVCALEVEKREDGRLGKVKGSSRNAYTAGVVCAKVARYAERQHHPERLATPLRRVGEKGRKDSFVPTGWEEALDVKRAHPDAVPISGGTDPPPSFSACAKRSWSSWRR